MFDMRGAVLCSVALILMGVFSASAAQAWSVKGYQSETLKPERVIIGLDLSQSNPLVKDKAYAAKVAARVKSMILPLHPRSQVIVRSFGVYATSANTLMVDQVISVRATPQSVGKGVQTLIANVPTLVAQGKLKAQPYTNILSFMDNMGNAFGCDDMPTHFVLLTDGVEDSEYARLRDKSQTLPPRTRPLSGDGCASLTILGLGQGLKSPAETERLRGLWRQWAKAAGFARFQALNDW